MEQSTITKSKITVVVVIAVVTTATATTTATTTTTTTNINIYHTLQRGGRRGLDTDRNYHHDNKSEHLYNGVVLRPLTADRACPTDLEELHITSLICINLLTYMCKCSLISISVQVVLRGFLSEQRTVGFYGLPN